MHRKNEVHNGKNEFSIRYQETKAHPIVFEKHRYVPKVLFSGDFVVEYGTVRAFDLENHSTCANPDFIYIKLAQLRLS